MSDSLTAAHPSGHRYYESRTRWTWRRILWASAIATALHLFFVLVLGPILKLDSARHVPTEVVQITPQELAKLKKEILRNKHLPALLQQELHEEYKTKEAPKDPKMMAPFNQTVPKERIAGAQPEAPRQGGGARAQRRQEADGKSRESAQEQLKLSTLGLGSEVPRPRSKAQPESSPMQGPPGPHSPVGREDKDLEKGPDNLLNAAESKYYSFFNRFEDPIVRNWYFLLRSHHSRIHDEMMGRRTRPGDELLLTVEFVLDRTGNFHSITVIESSGMPTLDWVTREAVAKLGMLPNPPPGLFEGGQYFTHRLRFGVYVQDSPLFQASPSLNWY